jgi:hypothetical protein
MNSQHDMAWPSVARVAGECGLSESTARRSLQLLCREGWLVNTGRSNVETKVYQATYPAQIQGVSQLQGVSQGPLGGVTATPELNKELNNTLSKGFKPPSIEEVTEYVATRDTKIDPETFVDWNTAKGWLIGKNKMKDWKASVRTWEKREQSNGHTQNNTRQPQHQRRRTKADEVRDAREQARIRQRGSDMGSVVETQ